MLGLALVDCDNFRERGKKSRVDLHLAAQTLVDDVARAFVSVFPDSRELDVRLYGGWTQPTGLPSRDASWLTELLPDLRGRRHGLIVRPSLATTMIAFPEVDLRGTVRGLPKRQRQKMVDGMMGCDAIYMVDHWSTYVTIVTDDDDLLPATLTAHAKNGNVLAWMRCRRIGEAINDTALLHQGVRIHSLGT